MNRIVFAFFIGLLMALTGSAVCAQQTAGDSQPAVEDSRPAAENTQPVPDSSAPEATPGAVPNVSAGQIQNKIDEITADTTLPEAERTAITEIYQTALEQLQQATGFSEEAAGLRRLLLDAPEETARLRRQLNEAAAPVELQVTGDTSLQQLESRLTTEQAQLISLQKRLEDLNRQLMAQQSRPETIRSELDTAQTALFDIERELAATPQDGDSALSEAQRLALTSRRLALRNQVDLLEQELQSYDVRLELLRAKAAHTAREVDISETRLAQLQDVINSRRRAEAAQTIRQSEAAASDTNVQSVIIKEAATRNSGLSKQLAALVDRIDRSTQRNVELNAQLKEIQESYHSIRQQLEIAGLSNALGPLLRSERRELPDIAQYQINTETRDQQITEARLDQFQIDEQRRKSPSMEEQIRELIAEQPNVAASDSELQKLKSELGRLLETRRQLLDKLSSGYASYIAQLATLDDSQHKLIETSGQYAKLLDEKLFWIASSVRVDLSWLNKLKEAMVWLVFDAPWRQTVQGLKAALLSKPLWIIVSLLVVFWLFWQRRQLRRRLRQMAGDVGNVNRDHFFLTIEALLITLFLALPVPFFLALGGWLLQRYGTGSEFPGAIGNGLLSAAFFGIIAISLRQICQRYGLAQEHFRWPVKSCRLLQRSLIWYTPIGMLASFTIGATEWASEDLYRDTQGRFAFVVGSLAFAVFLARLLHPRKGVLGKYLARRQNLLWHLRFIWYPLLILFPLALIAAALFGYYYTALELQSRFFMSGCLLLAAFFIASLVLRWLRIEQRRLAWTRARARREAMLAARSKEGEAGAAPGTDVMSPIQEVDVLDIEKVSEQSLGMLKLITVGAVAVLLWFIWANLIPALNFLNDWTLWQQAIETENGIEVTSITVGNGLLALVLLVLLLFVARDLPGLLEIVVLQRFSMDAGNRYAITTIVRYCITIIAFALTLNIIGIGWDKAQWLVAALSVGLGFGLQEIFANFVSGIIILLERPIRIGDAVTINNMDGFIKRIRIRATTILDWDNKEIVIPNKTFITGSFINWTLSDQVTRIVIPLRVAYGSDTALVQKLLLEMIETHPAILKEPKPWVLFRRFDDSSLGYEIWVYVRLMNERMPLIHELHTRIHQMLREHAIEIPFPQHDLHIRSVAPSPGAAA